MRESGSYILLRHVWKKWVPICQWRVMESPSGKEWMRNGQQTAQGVRRFRGVLDNIVPYGLQMDNREDRKDWTAG